MKRLLLIVALLLAGMAAHAQTAPVAPVIFRTFRFEAVMEADGRGSQTLTLEAQATTEAAARQLAQQALPFTEGMEQLQVIEAYTRKADGRQIKPAAEAVRIQDDPAVGAAPGFADRKRLLIAMPEVAAGDSIVLTWRRTLREPSLPGLLGLAFTFSRGVEWTAASVTLNVPTSLDLKVEAQDMVAETATNGARRVMRWTRTAKAVPEDPAAPLAIDRQPRLFVSSIPTWTALADTWMALAAPRMAVTPAVKSLADSIITEATDKAGEAALIHAWMMRNIRVLPVAPGVGSFVPHPADGIIAAGAGDTKDHAALAIALLAARNIQAVPVLLNSGNSFTLSAAPTLSGFSQVILFLPELGTFTDTATYGAPFGVLPFGAYGKPVVLARNGGSELKVIPPVAPGVATSRIQTQLRLEPDGRMAGESVAEAAGPFVIEMRRATLVAQQGDPARAGQPPVSPGGLAATASISGKFESQPQPGLMEGDPFPMPSGLRLLRRPGDMLLGPLDARAIPPGEPIACHAGRQEEAVELRFPLGTRPGRVPKDVSISTADFSYESRWKLEAGLLSVRRVVESRLTVPRCEGAQAEQAAAALQRIRRDLRTQIWVEVE
jgi:hypothetical protein